MEFYNFLLWINSNVYLDELNWLNSMQELQKNPREIAGSNLEEVSAANNETKMSV